MDTKKHLPSESWESFDADALFPPPRLHVNKVTKVDKKEGMKKVAPPEGDFGEQPSGPSDSDELGDTYCDAPADQKGHVDELMEMEGLEGGTPDNRDVQADKTEDKRTPKDSPSEESAEKEASGQEPAEAKGEKAQPPKDGKEAPKEKEGAEKPIQKESEGVEEVAEATSKTSEDVHGGDEATKDIEDSPNAADDGENPDNHGAEKGKGGEEGGGKEGADGAGNPGDGNGDDGQGDCSGDPETGSKDPLAEEDWEKRADQAVAANLLDQLNELEAKSRDEKGHRTGLPNYNFDRESSPAELEIAFRKASELLRKFANEEDLTARRDGNTRWDAKTLVRNVVAYRHPRIPSSKYERPKNADICILLDISGSCAQQAEMFMAIAAGSIGCGVRVFVGYNGTCRACEMQAPKRRIKHYDQAKPWVQAEVQRVAGWQNARGIGEWAFEQFLEEVEPKTVIIFGDWDGIDQYTGAVQKTRFKKIRFFWFANEDFGRRRRGNSESEDRIPKGFTKKNYVPGVFTPRDFASALKRLK